MAHKNFYDFVCSEKEDLDEKAKKGDVSLADVQYADLLEHYLKSANTNEAMKEAKEESGYSGRYMPYYGGTSYAGEGNRDGGNSYARGRGSNAKSDSMGRYSRRSYSRNDGYSYADGMEELLGEMRDMLPGLSDEKRHKAEMLMDELRR